MKTGTLLFLTKEDLTEDYSSDKFKEMTVADVDVSARERMNIDDFTVFYDEDLETLKVLKNRFGQTSISGIDTIDELSMISKLKMLWFSQWLAMNYCNILNDMTGIWYIEQMSYFNEDVFPNMLKTSMNDNLLDKTLDAIKENY